MAETKFLDNAGLKHLFEKINAKFSKLGHKHTKADITDFAHNHNDLYYGKTEVDSKLSGKSNTSHNHDDRYYTESEINAKLAAEAKARTDADTSIDTAYKAADTALGTRIDNAEAEISDLQAEDWYEFAATTDPSAQKERYEQMLSRWPKCYMIVNINNDQGKIIRPVFLPVRRTDTHVYLRAVVQTTHNDAPGFLLEEIRVGLNEDGSVNVAARPSFIPLATWETLTKKPFSTIGSGLKVVDNALTVDASEHNHNDLYYQKSEVDGKLSGKAAASHKHGAADITSVNASAINGVIAAANLPSFVDDVIEGYLNGGKFYKEKKTDGIYATEITAETGKIYVNLNDSKTYRWSGSAYVVISETIALGETSSTAYRGDRGAAAYSHAAAKGSAFASGLYKITTNAQGHVTAATAVQKSDITSLGIPAQDTTYNALTNDEIDAAFAAVFG